MPLHTYDGILGLDWLAQDIPMYIDWVLKWLSFTKAGQIVTLHEFGAEDCTYTCIAISAVQMDEHDEIPLEIRSILDAFADGFETPTQLPPRRSCDHKIPLIPGARPVAVRPYRVVPQLKDELEKQIA